MDKNKPYLVLGIDAGIGSAGWSLLDIASNKIVDLGVHLWEVPQVSKTSIAALSGSTTGVDALLPVVYSTCPFVLQGTARPAASVTSAITRRAVFPKPG